MRKTVLVVVVLAVALGAAGFGWWRHDRLPADAVLRYDGHTVTKSQLDARVNVLSALYGVRRPGGTKESAFRRDAAKSMAVSLVLDRETRRRGILISDKQARDELGKLVDQQLSGGQEAFTQFLADKGLSESDVLSEIKEQMATSRLAEQITGASKPVTSTQARAFYDANRAKMTTDASRHLRNIVVSSQDVARRVAARARAGADFAGLARRWSQDGSTRKKGGDLGSVTQAQLEPTYGKAAFSARPGRVFGPVHTQYGWNVGQVVSVAPPVSVAFATVEKSLVTALENQAKLALWKSFLSRLLKGADVEYADAYRPSDPAGLPSSLTTGQAAP